MNKVIIIDNYDSFTYNLVHYIEQFTDKYKVVRNNEVDINEIQDFDKILFSPGPGLPSEVKIMNVILARFASTKSILGICLGHQAIGEFYGASLKNLNEVNHGVEKKTIITDKSDYLFKDLPKEFLSGRYHSWVIDNNTINDNLLITAIDEDKEIMAISHKELDVKAVQFHPESIMTPIGIKIIENWMKN